MTKNIKNIKKPAKKRTDSVLDALTKISQLAASDLYLEDILKLIVTVTAEVLGSKICSLMLIDPATNELIIRATQSVSDAYNKKPNIKLGQGVAGMVAKDNKPMVISDVKTDPRYVNREVAKKEGICSLLSVPMSVKGKVIGVLNSYTSTPHEFSDKEINVLTTVANQAAIVIENAKLLLEAKLAKEELLTRKLVERAKGILMKQEALDEEKAFRMMQKFSMDNRKSMRDVAEAIIMSSELKKG